MAGPVKKWNVKGIEVAMWEGSTGPRFSIQKRYKDKASGEWKESKSFFKEELSTLRTLLDDAIIFLSNDAPAERNGGFASAGQIVSQVEKMLGQKIKPIDLEDDINF